MEEVTNLTQEEVNEIIKNEFPVIPRRSRVIITVNVNDSMFEKTGFSETQYVMAVGNNITDIKPGQAVLMDVEKMMVYEQGQEDVYEKVGHIKLKPINVGDRMYALVTDNVIEAIDNRVE